MTQGLTIYERIRLIRAGVIRIRLDERSVVNQRVSQDYKRERRRNWELRRREGKPKIDRIPVDIAVK